MLAGCLVWIGWIAANPIVWAEDAEASAELTRMYQGDDWSEEGVHSDVSKAHVFKAHQGQVAHVFELKKGSVGDRAVRRRTEANDRLGRAASFLPGIVLVQERIGFVAGRSVLVGWMTNGGHPYWFDVATATPQRAVESLARAMRVPLAPAWSRPEIPEPRAHRLGGKDLPDGWYGLVEAFGSYPMVEPDSTLIHRTSRQMVHLMVIAPLDKIKKGGTLRSVIAEVPGQTLEYRYGESSAWAFARKFGRHSLGVLSSESGRPGPELLALREWVRALPDDFDITFGDSELAAALAEKRKRDSAPIRASGRGRGI